MIFLVDDLGIADLGCFGNDTIKTPNIDRLAEQGARLRHDVTPDSICTPNRAAFLTGRYPIGSGLATDGDMRVFIFTSASGGLPKNETTFAEVASDAAYRTGQGQTFHHNPILDTIIYFVTLVVYVGIFYSVTVRVFNSFQRNLEKARAPNLSGGGKN